jgi:hypothetical protein
MQKNTAYAWRQLVFYLALAERSELDEFLVWSSAHLNEQSLDSAPASLRFSPVSASQRAARASTPTAATCPAPAASSAGALGGTG